MESFSGKVQMQMMGGKSIHWRKICDCESTPTPAPTPTPFMLWSDSMKFEVGHNVYTDRPCVWE